MDIFLPKGFEPSKARAPKSRPVRVCRLGVEVDGIRYPVLRRWDAGFAVAAGDVPVLGGVVDLFDGSEHLHQCLISGHETVNDERIFRVKRAVGVDYAAAVQFEDQVQASL